MATGRGINPKSVFTRTNPGDPAQRIPVQPTDGQLGYDVRTRDRWGVKVQNDTDQVVAFRVLGFTFEDATLSKAFELVASANVAAAAVGRARGTAEGLAKLQVEIDPAAAATGGVTVVFGTDVDG